jgi:putative transposase
MARVPRKLQLLPNHSVHKIWRGHNREWNLGTPAQKAAYLGYLNDDFESDRYKTGSKIRALTLMSNHTHELFNILEPKEFSGHMRRHHSRYGAFFNRTNQRLGKVAQDRPKTCLIGDPHHEMVTIFYIHANPLRAKMVGDAKDYAWSTHRLYAFGKRDPWMKHVELPGWYMKLGHDGDQRQRKYRQLFARYLKETGLVKQSFLHRRFFGPLSWESGLEKKVTLWRVTHSPPG